MKLTNTIRDAYVRGVMADVPSTDYSQSIRDVVLADAVEQLPEKVRALWKDEATKNYVGMFWYGGPYGVTSVMVPGVESLFKLSPAAQDKVAGYKALLETQIATAGELKRKVHAAAYSVSTRKALADLIPEFSKYLPPDDAAAIRTLPAVANVMADFVKAGWPKGEVKPKAKAKA